jgi:sulfatase maturation enzyme AslB (radical SAM superfamily)
MNNKINIATRIFKSIFFNQVPNYSIIYIDGRCNMLCSFCCHAAMDARKTPLMPATKWGHIFKRAKSLLHLTVTGGEPFVRKDFVEIIDNIIQNSGVPRVSINTNGFYTERIKNFIPELIEKHKNTEFTLSISVDGPENIHDKVRNFKGAFKQLLETIKIMKVYREKPNFFLKLSSVLTKDNKDYLEDFMSETSNWAIDFHELILVRDVPVKEQLEIKETYEKLCKIQNNRVSKHWKKSFNSKVFEKLYLETLKRIDSNKVHSPCLAGGRLVEIFSDGVVRGCETKKLWDISNIGNLNEADLDIVDIIQTTKAKEFRKIARKCTCTFECASAINTIYNPKHWISLI